MVAIFGPTGVGKTATAIALAERLRDNGGDAVAIGSDALQVYEGLQPSPAPPRQEEREQLEHRLVGFVPVTQKFDVGQYMPLAHAEIDAALERGPHADRGGRHGPLHARGAGGPVAEAGGRGRGERAVVHRHPAPDAAHRPEHGPRASSTSGSSSGWTRSWPAARGRRRRAADAAGASHTARKALGFDELLRGDLDAMRKRSRNYARRQLTWMRKVPGLHEIDVTERTPDQAASEIERLLDRPSDP